MPTYDFKCERCGHEFETIISFKKLEETETGPCPNCNQQSLKQVITRASVIDPFVAGRMKYPDEWKGFINRMKKKNPGGNVNVHW